MLLRKTFIKYTPAGAALAYYMDRSANERPPNISWAKLDLKEYPRGYIIELYTSDESIGIYAVFDMDESAESADGTWKVRELGFADRGSVVNWKTSAIEWDTL